MSQLTAFQSGLEFTGCLDSRPFPTQDEPKQPSDLHRYALPGVSGLSQPVDLALSNHFWFTARFENRQQGITTPYDRDLLP
jgi:hypothetical protein